MPPLPTQELAVSANAPSAFRVVSQPSWINVQPATALTTPAKLIVTANATGMAAGSYQGNILLSGPNDITVPVSLTIAGGAAHGNAFHDRLRLRTRFSGAAAPNGAIASSAGALPFSVAASTESGVKWLDVTPTAGSTPGTITVSVNVAQLVPGRHSGTVGSLSAGQFVRLLLKFPWR